MAAAFLVPPARAQNAEPPKEPGERHGPGAREEHEDHDEGDEQKEREEYYRLQNFGSTIAPAAGALAAWFAARDIPVFRDLNGTSASWEEIGPRVLLHGWGDMENVGRSCAIAIDPRDDRVIYVGAASGGIWKSTDRAKTWEPIADFQASLSYGALAIDPFNPDIIYAGTGEAHYSLDSFHGAGMLRSMDGGKSWELLASDVFLGERFTRIVCSPKRPGLIFASTTIGVYRSTDSGATWVKVLDGPASDLIMHPRDPETLIAGIGSPWGNPLNGVYRTTDSGNTWHKVTRDLYQDGRGLGRIQMDFCRLRYPDVVYASLYGTNGDLRGMYKSTDFGESWLRLPNAPNYAGDTQWYYDYVAVSPVNPNVVFCGGFSTFRTVDGGQTWEDDTKSYAGGQVHPDHHAFAFDPDDPNVVYLGTDGGVFRSPDLGEHWESVSRGMGTLQFQFVDVHPWDKNIAYGGTQDNGTNKYTGTTAWTNVFLGDGGTTRVNWVNPDIVYTEYVGLAMCKSTDAGQNWDWSITDGLDRSDGALFYAPFNLDPSNPDILLAGTHYVWRTTDGCKTWSRISPALGGEVSAVTVAPNNSKVIYAGTSDGRVWVTPDTGSSWYELTRGFPRRQYVGDIAVDPRNARVVYVSFAAWGGSHIWKSTDAGGTWENVGDNLPEMPIRAIALDPRRPDVVYVGTEIGVFVSTQGGGRWARLGKGLPNSPVFSMTANRRTGFITVGTHGRGAWRIALPE
jgi:photosystem II stability/assembly factor-like uncharacterized protein